VEVIRRVITLAFSAAVLAAAGLAAASTVTAEPAALGGVTITITVPNTSTTLTVPKAATSTVVASRAKAQLRAALADPAKVSSVTDPRARRKLTTELRALDAFLSSRPKLRPYRAHIWYVAHHSRTTSVSPRALAALLWCTVWFPRDCS
jgi:hypothetical protein